MAMVQEYLAMINTWAYIRRGLEFRDARGHVLRSSQSPLPFPVSASNDVVLTLRRYVSYPELGAFLGIEMKKALTRKGLRQAEIEFYLWGGCSLFPYVQVITDMQTGGAAFYQTASASEGVVLGAFQEDNTYHAVVHHKQTDMTTSLKIACTSPDCSCHLR